MILSKTIVGPGRSMARSPSRRVSIFSIRSNFPPAIQDITPFDGARMWRSGCWKAEIIGVPIEWKMARKNRFSEVPKRLGCNLPSEPPWLPSSWCSRRPRSLGPIDPIRKTIMPMKCLLMRARSSGHCFPLWMVPSFFVETVIGSMPRKIRRQGCGNLAADQEVPDTSWDGRKAIKGPSTDFCAWQVGILAATPGGMSWVSHDWC